MPSNLLGQFSLSGQIFLHWAAATLKSISLYKGKGAFTNYVDKILAFLTSYLLHWHFLWYADRQKWTFLDHLPTSSCKHSLWMTPKKEHNILINCLLLIEINRKLIDDQLKISTIDRFSKFKNYQLVWPTILFFFFFWDQTLCKKKNMKKTLENGDVDEYDDEWDVTTARPHKK